MLDRQSYSANLLKGLGRFLQSAADVPLPLHFDRQGLLETLPSQAFESFCRQATEHVGAIWDAMQLRTSGLPLTHDGYLKLWSLSRGCSLITKTDLLLVALKGPRTKP
jgi:hypothetical protein